MRIKIDLNNKTTKNVLIFGATFTAGILSYVAGINAGREAVKEMAKGETGVAAQKNIFKYYFGKERSKK